MGAYPTNIAEATILKVDFKNSGSLLLSRYIIFNGIFNINPKAIPRLIDILIVARVLLSHDTFRDRYFSS